MNTDLLRVSLRQGALYLPHHEGVAAATPGTLALVTELRSMGFVPDEPLMHALNALDEDERRQVADTLNDVMGINLNWASLVKGWLVPTGETLWDHFLTMVANALTGEQAPKGTTLPCGHLIPDGTFPLERYNGCPYCGTPFATAHGVNRGQGSRLRLLTLWDDSRLSQFMATLLASPVPLDASQRESLLVLLRWLPMPREAVITMKETRLLVASRLADMGRCQEAGRLLESPADVMRLLWYRHTGHVQLLQPRTLLHTTLKNHRYERNSEADRAARVAEERQRLRLRYSRAWCRMVADWLNGMTMPVDRQLESMHPQREMWVRFIRALRLAEMARRPGYGRLALLLDRFYRQDYEVWKGRVDQAMRRGEAATALRLLQQRPGVFARCLFATMLRLGPEPVLQAFSKVLASLPSRLVLTLGAQARNYFSPSQQRVARPLSGLVRAIPPHALLQHYSEEQLHSMAQAVGSLYLETMRQRYAARKTAAATVYIAPELEHIPVSVGDRQATVQDVSAALQGTRFPVKGDAVRLFLQWGKGLPAQHLDMDLSCYILTDTQAELCAYFNLTTQGARHSGDIQHIPDQVGTAEYIELQMPELKARGARRVVFTCNAYTAGQLQPGLMVGWMSCEHPMTVSDETGVAYDPSTVDHLVRITEPNLTKGLIFGVLEVDSREIIWLEMPFDGQTVLNVNPDTIEAYLDRLKAKPTLGQVLRVKAEAQGQTVVDSPDQADEAYTALWAQDTALVNGLLMG